MNKLTLILGDTHGRWKPVLRKLDEYDIRGARIIGVGDIGIGFKSGDTPLFELNEEFKRREIEFMSIRGNHDIPRLFRENYKLLNVELIPDYTLREIDGEKFLFVGGAISIDRSQRIRGEYWWEDEVFQYLPEKVQDCDVLVTHVPPTWSHGGKPGAFEWFPKDVTLADDCRKEREECDLLIAQCKPRTHYCGHFHVSWAACGPDGVLSRILNIYELYEH